MKIKQLMLTLSLTLITTNALALTKPEKVQLINKKSETVLECLMLYSAKSVVHKRSKSQKENEYLKKAKQAEKLYLYLQTINGKSINKAKEEYSSVFEKIKIKYKNDIKLSTSFVNKMKSDKISKEEKNCNRVLRFPRSSLRLNKATRPFYQKTYMNIDKKRKTNCR